MNPRVGLAVYIDPEKHWSDAQVERQVIKLDAFALPGRYFYNAVPTVSNN